jgi:hypothetical protein
MAAEMPPAVTAPASNLHAIGATKRDAIKIPARMVRPGANREFLFTDYARAHDSSSEIVATPHCRFRRPWNPAGAFAVDLSAPGDSRGIHDAAQAFAPS